MKRADAKSKARAEASIWFSRLCSETRSTDLEAGFRAWLQEDPEHQAAFDLVNTAWDLIGEERPRRRPLASREMALAAGFAAVAVAVGAILTAVHMQPRAQSYETGFGEQRRIALADGSSVLLDTSTSIKVSMSKRKRSVELLHGRGHFEVAKDDNRPFAVKMGDRQVIAVGTVFDIDHEAGLTSVILTQGKVLVENSSSRRMLSPGDRLAFDHGRVIADRPDIEVVTGWSSGRAIFKSRPLKDAVAELNRYSRHQLELIDQSMGDILISGNYHTGDNEAFAAALSAILPLDVDPVGDRIFLRPRKSVEGGSSGA